MFEWNTDVPIFFHLPIKALFNIRADELAGIVERPPTHPYHPLWLLPAEKVRLDINNIPVYGNYANTIRQAYTVPPMLAYLRERHHWTAQIQDTVNWKVLEQATKYSRIPAPQLLILVHNKMPTRHEQAKSNAFLSHRCPACRDNETFTHLLWCLSAILRWSPGDTRQILRPN